MVKGEQGFPILSARPHPTPFFCECAVSGSARHGTLTYFSGAGRPSQREAGENWKALKGEAISV